MTQKDQHLPPLPPDVRRLVEQRLGRRPDLADAYQQLPRVHGAITRALEAGHILYLCGNGGSFADAIHIKGELAKV